MVSKLQSWGQRKRKSIKVGVIGFFLAVLIALIVVIFLSYIFRWTGIGLSQRTLLAVLPGLDRNHIVITERLMTF